MTMSYTDMLIALSEGKYSAKQIADVCTQYNITPEQLYTDLYGSDKLTFLKTKNGTTTLRGVASTEYGGFYGGATTTGEKAALEMEKAINSNASGVTTKTAVKTRIPISSTLNQAGKVTLNTELAHIGGQAIPGTETLSIQTVGLALAAAGVGIAAGKAFDSVLYNLNPDFFDEHGMSTLNPETWDMITADISENDPAYLRWGASAFDAIFRTNQNTGQAQMYLTQEQIAYMMGFLIEQGAFSAATQTSDWTNLDNELISAAFPKTFYPDPMTLQTVFSWVWSNGSVSETYVIQPVNGYRLAVITDPTHYRFKIIAVCDQNNPFYYIKDGTPVALTTSSYTYNGRTYYYFSTMQYDDNYIEVLIDNADVVNQDSGASQWRVFDGASGWNIGEILFRGNISGGQSIEGISDQENATIFDASGISDASDTASIISALQTQFPDWFDPAEGIRQEVVTENGTVENVDYYPVPIPDFTPSTLNQPTGGTDNATQQNPSIDPDIWPQDFIQTIAQMLMQEPVTGEEDTANPPDTGNGNTPVVTPPAGSATALWSIYNPTQAQVNAFGAWLWSNDFVEQLKKIFNDPMESVISLHKIFGTPSTGGAQNIAVGYLNSGVSSAVVTAQYTEVDCGSVQLSEYFGNVYDYKDTSIELYLPFIGIVPLSVSDVMRASIHVLYHIDVITGACLADVEVIRDAGAGGVLYQYSGDCAVHYPVSAGSYMGIVTGILSIAGGIAGTIATGGAAAPALIGAGAAATRLHTDVSRSGGFSGNAGAMGAKVPYLIISRAQTALPENYLDIEGIGSNKTVMLNTCSGYTRVKEIYMQGVGDATEGELNELETLLKEGVIFPITETTPND